MEQRNEMLKNMRLSERQKKGDVQHLLSRSFSQRGFSGYLSPPADVSIPVPAFPIPTAINEEEDPSAEHSSNDPASKDTVSISELSVEPRVAGGIASALNQGDNFDTNETRRGGILVQLEDFDTGATRVASLSATGGMAFIESESGEESCSEEKAVRTPLLVGAATSTGVLPRMAQPAIHSYDKMFDGDEEEQRLSGAATLNGEQQHLGVPGGGPTPYVNFMSLKYSHVWQYIILCFVFTYIVSVLWYNIIFRTFTGMSVGM